MTHLHTRSMYSLLESPFRPERIAAAAKASGMRHAALTDLNVMHGVPAFAQACKAYGIKPIFGMETVADGIRLLLHAKNDAGLQQLYHLSTLLQTEKLTAASIQNLCRDCFVTALAVDDLLDKAIQQEDWQTLASLLSRLKENGPLYLAEAMMDSGLRRSRLPEVSRAAASLDIPMCAVSYVLYEQEEDVEVLQVLKAVSQNTTREQVSAGIIWHRQFYPPQEMEILYSPAALANAQAMVQAMDADPDRLPKNTLPAYVNRNGLASHDWLEKLARAGLSRRLKGWVPAVYQQRLDHELNVIHSMGFDDYFLVVYDMIRWSIQNGILTGPGRGSAAGSLTAYCLGITHIDPVKSGLLFERFLNPARISMPDIDTDFPDDRREEVIRYLQETYGPEHAVQIVAFSNFKARQALRDAAKALGFGDKAADSLCALVPNVPGMSLQQAWDTIPLFQKRIREKKDLSDIYAMARRIEGLPRHTTLHAAGVVLAKEAVEAVCPLVQLDGAWATQFTMDHLEACGLIKIDVLSLRNLTIIRQVLDMLKEQGIELQPWQMEANDPRTFDLLGRGDTLGIFQLEKEGIRQLLRNMKPSCFADIAVVLALYRPGPMQEIPRYLENRAHPDRIQYPHPMLEPILRETYGVMIYQEQIMEAAVRMGGLTLSEADLLRKAMSKKQKDKMEPFKAKFVSGAERQGVDRQTAENVFDLMERFSGYGFNKSHSYAYGQIAWVMAYLKANHPLEFYACLLNGVLGSEVKTGQYLYECRSRNIPVYPVDLRVSGRKWVQEGPGLRMPLTLLKGLGTTAVSRILALEEKSSDPITLISRLWAEKLTEKQIQVLAGSGALDYTGYNRATLLDNIPRILNYAHIVRVENQAQLFDYSIASPPTLVRVKENRLEKSRLEKEAFGFYVNEHPVAALRKRYPNAMPIQQAEGYLGNLQVMGRVGSLHSHRTKKGDMMAFVTLEDETGQIDLAIMPKLYQSQRDRIVTGNLLVVWGKKDRPGSILVNRMDVVRLD